MPRTCQQYSQQLPAVHQSQLHQQQYHEHHHHPHKHKTERSNHLREENGHCDDELVDGAQLQGKRQNQDRSGFASLPVCKHNNDDDDYDGDDDDDGDDDEREDLRGYRSTE